MAPKGRRMAERRSSRRRKLGIEKEAEEGTRNPTQGEGELEIQRKWPRERDSLREEEEDGLGWAEEEEAMGRASKVEARGR